MNPHKRELLAYLRAQKHESFSVSKRLDGRRLVSGSEGLEGVLVEPHARKRSA